MSQSMTLTGMIDKLAESIINIKKKNIALIGVNTIGDIIAKRIQKKCVEQNELVFNGVLDISLFENKNSETQYLSVGKTDIPFSLHDKCVVLVFDKIDTGSNVLSALNILADYDFPRQIKICTLLHKESDHYPINVEFSGLKCNCTDIEIKCFEIDGEDDIIINKEVVLS